MTTTELYQSQLLDIVESDATRISDIKPSVWAEQNVIMEEPFPGLYRYSLTPYCREIIDCFAIDHPMLWLAIMKGAQIGISSGVLIPMLLWSIVNDPCRIYFMVGSPDLVDKATEKLDKGIDGAGIRDYIKAQVQRKRSTKSGDTNYKKDFPGGFIQIDNPNNHANLRDVSLRKGVFDDFEAVKTASLKAGSTRKMLEQRFAAYEGRHKICYCSTPEIKEGSNIESAYLLGDQRKYLIPCPCCGEFIEWKWSVEGSIGDRLIQGGISWKLDEANKLIPESVGYVCQKCGEFFDDKNKGELLNNGFWQPTAVPSKPGYYSYHISALYAPLGMYDWKHYVEDYLEANPVGQPRIEHLWKTFVNVVLGETYEPAAMSPKANSIQKNIRNYKVGSIPEKLSMSDGNGRIILLTCAADMNGKEDDARLDYEIVGWSEAGASYSIRHGSIGTFVPRENSKKFVDDREKWTYDHGKFRNVWDEFSKIIFSEFLTDTGRKMKIRLTGLDCGYFSTNYAYPFIDKINPLPNIYVIGLKGKKNDEYIRFDADKKYFTPARERPLLYSLTVGNIKDDLADYMQLRWNENDPSQPFGFMNFPTPENGLYTYTNYFEHFESEHCVTEATKDGHGVSSRWQKKSGNVMNHMFDCFVYNMAVKDILMDMFRREMKEPKMTWKEFAFKITGGK